MSEIWENKNPYYVVDMKMRHKSLNEIEGKDIIPNGFQITQNSLENPMGEGGNEEFLIKCNFIPHQWD